MLEESGTGLEKSLVPEHTSDELAKKILIVEDDPVEREALEEFLQLNDFMVLSVASAAQALKILKKTDFDLVLTDLVMPEMDGISMTRAIRDMGKDIPVLVMTGFASIEYAVEAIKAGATDFITKPLKLDHVVFIINRVLETRSLRIKAMETEYYKDLSNRDELTKISNYRHFNYVLQLEIDRQLRYHRPLTLLIIDIDDFKKCNDAHGHLTGDMVLVKVASLLTTQIRSCDFVARYGGDEFTVILPEISEKEALPVCRRIMKSIAACEFQSFEKKAIGPLSVTIGIASFPTHAVVGRELIEKADQAMYSGKRAGKNCICIFGDEINILH
ncbi:MAG: diguanylate cyclase [Candidatus Aminicenantes bacterium]|nr:diguanylate cyclase [Candidatus Aminicenantes bacterium]